MSFLHMKQKANQLMRLKVTCYESAEKASWQFDWHIEEEENEWKIYQTKFTDAFLTSEINKDLDGEKCFHPLKNWLRIMGPNCL